MNGNFVASRSVSLARMLIALDNNYQDKTSITPQGKAALKGAAEEIASMQVSAEASAYNTALRSLLVSMTNQLNSLAG